MLGLLSEDVVACNWTEICSFRLVLKLHVAAHLILMFVIIVLDIIRKNQIFEKLWTKDLGSSDLFKIIYLLLPSWYKLEIYLLN